MGWTLRKTPQTYQEIPLAAGVSGSVQLSIASGWVFLNGREIAVPSGNGVVAVLPEEARPVYSPLYGLIGRTGSGLFAHFSLTTPGGALTLRQGTAHTVPMYFTLSWPQAVRKGF